MYLREAVLRISGDLETMVEDWSDAEFAAKRRLVQFRRSRNSSTITIDFNSVTSGFHQPHSICISCIWWDSKQEFLVTSTDVILLLEFLAALQFTVREKDRIRRDLEEFNPLTVSKGKIDSKDLFKLIMGFPDPKPRYVEKGIKVFSWKILPHALTKILHSPRVTGTSSIEKIVPTMSPQIPATSSLDAKDTPAKSNKRCRLSKEGHASLREFFNQNLYPDEGQKEMLAARIGVTKKQISNWFVNAPRPDRSLVIFMFSSVKFNADNESRILCRDGYILLRRKNQFRSR